MSYNKNTKRETLGWLVLLFQNVKLKEYFYDGDTTTNKVHQVERCHLNTKLPTCDFNRPIKFFNSQKELTELLKKPKYQQSNLTAE